MPKRKDSSSAPLKPMPSLPEMGAPKRPKKLRRPPTRPLGPRIYRMAKKPDLFGIGPGEPPLGFVTAHTSKSEWRYYWGLAKVFNDPVDPRQPPFSGGKLWSYQKAIEGGRQSPGGSVVDFVVQWGQAIIGLRIQTERWHVFANDAVKARDFYVKTHIKAIDHVIDLYDQWSLGDITGQATVAQLKRALRLNQEEDPAKFGTAEQVREPR